MLDTILRAMIDSNLVPGNEYLLPKLNFRQEFLNQDSLLRDYATSIVKYLSHNFLTSISYHQSN